MNLDGALQTYIAESRELLHDMETQLLAVEQETDQAEMLNAIFRAAHTIKGSAGLFGLDEIVAFTHGVEGVLDRLRNGELGIQRSLIELMLDCHDHIGHLIDNVDHGAAPLTNELKCQGQQLSERLQQTGTAILASAVKPPVSVLAEAERSHWHVTVQFGADCMRDGMDPLSFIHYLRNLGDITDMHCADERIPQAPDMDPEACYLGFEIDLLSSADQATIESVFDFVRPDSLVQVEPRAQESPAATTQDELIPLEIPAAVAFNAPASGSASPAPARDQQTIRVDAHRLDNLVNLIGELVIASAGMSINAFATGQNTLIESASAIARLVEEVRDSALNLRMVQIGATFNRFHRVVRDACHDLGKEIDLIVTGAETELDKTVVEKITDPLLHLVRNAVDHGIETTEVRQARGKPEKGTIKLNAYHDSGNIVIEISDDGAGLNRDKILQKAIAKGLVTADQQLVERDIFDLIFEPGFSTADQVSNLSGRGVGMDVVKRNITALRGSINVTSEEGQGTRISVRLPLTLAIIDGFLVGVGDTAYVVPLDAVVKCVELPADIRIEAGDNRYINLHGDVLPFISLRELFACPGTAPGRQSIVVFRFGDIKAGIVVDRLLGEFQTVIKPMGKIFSNLRGVSGSTILGNGQVALILDVQGLVKIASLDRIRRETRVA